MGLFPWDSHRNDIPMDKLRVVHVTYLAIPFPSRSNLCLSHPMGRFPWDAHRNPIPMDKLGYIACVSRRSGDSKGAWVGHGLPSFLIGLLLGPQFFPNFPFKVVWLI